MGGICEAVDPDSRYSEFMNDASGAEIRQACREGKLTSPTPGLALGFVQANLVMLPQDWAFEFMLFCRRNEKPCPATRRNGSR